MNLLEELANNVTFMANATKAHLSFLLYLVLLLWVIFLLTRLSGNRLLFLGIFPRRLVGLPGILFSPFLHGNFNHLFFNSIPLVVLSNFILFYGYEVYFIVTIMIALISGILIWCFAKPGIHIGASSVITGYWSFLVINSYQQGTFMAVALGVISLYYFAGIFFGIFPSKKGVSWEGHLFGLVAGILTAYSINYII